MSVFARELSDKLSAIYKNVTRLEEDALKSSNINLTISELHLVCLLYKFENGITVSDIAKIMNVSKPTTTVAVNRIVKKEYAIKMNDIKDRRITVVKLTEAGYKVVLLHKKCQRDVVSKLGQDFTNDERNILLKAIDKLDTYFKPKEE